MRLLQSVLPTLLQTKKPQQKFLAHLLGLLRMLPGHATCRNLSRYRAYHERTLARCYARDFDFVSRNKAAIIRVSPPAHEPALVSDARFVPKSGQQTSGLDRSWNGSHSRTEQGRALSALAGLDSTDHCAYGLRVAQPPPADKTTDTEATRIDVSLAPLTRGVSAHRLRPLRDVIPDGYDSKQQCTAGVRALGLAQSGPRRIAAHLRALSQGPQRPGPGRPQTYDGKGPWDNLAHCEKVATDDDAIVLSPQVLNHGPYPWNLRVGRVVDTTHNRRAVLLRTDIDVDALTMSRYDQARCPIAFLLRDAKQCTGLTDCQARSQAKRNLHCHASLSAVTFAKLDALQQSGEAASVFSMASLKRRAFHQHLIEHISQH
jgi:hypothetical protein